MNLNDRYYARFGLEYNPFIKNNSSYFFFESKDAEEVWTDPCQVDTL